LTLVFRTAAWRFAIEAQVHPTAVRRILHGLFDEVADERGDDEQIFGQRNRLVRREAEVDLACGELPRSYATTPFAI